MSRRNPMTIPTSGVYNTAPVAKNYKIFVNSAVLLLQDDHVIGDGDVKLEFGSTNTPNDYSWVGFKLVFPLGPRIEDEGFGCCHHVDHKRGLNNVGLPWPVCHRVVTFIFRHEDIAYCVRPATPDERAMAPGGREHMSVVDVSLADGRHTLVAGAGLPFSHPGHASEGWLLKDEPIIGRHTIASLAKQENFRFIVNSPEGVLKSHWGVCRDKIGFKLFHNESTFWDIDMLRSTIERNKGGVNKPLWCFADDSDHLAVLSHAVAQDVLWLAKAADEFRVMPAAGYFVVPEGRFLSSSPRLYVIMSMPPGAVARHENAWRKLVDGPLKLAFFRHAGDVGGDKVDKWPARVIDKLGHIHSLQSHRPSLLSEVVLEVYRPSSSKCKLPDDFDLKTFPSYAHAKLAFKEDRSQ